MLAAPGAALASSAGTQSLGQTASLASFAFVVRADLSGSVYYSAAASGPNAGFAVHCSDVDSYGFKQTSEHLTKVVATSSSCADQDGTQIFLRASLIDGSDTGTGDWLSVAWDYSPPVYVHRADVIDRGTITSGDISVYSNPQGLHDTVAEMSGTPSA